MELMLLILCLSHFKMSTSKIKPKHSQMPKASSWQPSVMPSQTQPHSGVHCKGQPRKGLASKSSSTTSFQIQI